MQPSKKLSGVLFGRWSRTSTSEAAQLETRGSPPQLRPLAIAVISLVILGMVALLGISLCVSQLTNDLGARLKNSEQTLAAALAEVNRDLSSLPTDTHLSDQCSAELQAELARLAIGSLLVREFYMQSAESSAACGGFGDVAPFWRVDLAKDSLQVVPAESIRAGIVVAKVFGNRVAVALLDPRQLLDRLPGSTGGDTFALKTVDGFRLAALGDLNSVDRSSIVHPVERKLGGWPLVLEAIASQRQLSLMFRGQLIFWLMASVLISALVVLLLNRYIEQQSSRAVRLQMALKKRRFAPVVQPIVDSVTGQCVGAEVLMRWKHPVRGLLAPAEFIDYAERSGLIVPMSDLLMRQAHQQLAEIAVANPSLYFSFNITPAQLRTPNFAQSLLDIFDGSPLGPSRVVLELTERDLVDEYVRDELTNLRKSGFKIAIDDFGTGHSSLAVLQDLTIDKLKVDRAFVKTISSDALAQPVLDAIIELAHRLKLSIVAEGIETLQQADYLKAKGVQTLQGYYFAKPLTPLDFATWLGARQQAQPSSAATSSVGLDLNQVLQDLQVARSNLEINRWYRLRYYPNCLLGNEIVSWLASNYDLPREKALRLGKRLIARGYLVHVSEEHDLEDAPYFYRLLTMAAVNESRGNAVVFNKPVPQLLAWLHGKQGVAPGKRYFHGLMFSDAVSGAEVVDGLVRAGGLDREQARALGVQLMRQGQIKHSFDELGFLDSEAHYYHLSR
jgi:EAL domain-containing protein (putative c-di-GMP-specific phosphodiesterase class I)